MFDSVGNVLLFGGFLQYFQDDDVGRVKNGLFAVF